MAKGIPAAIVTLVIGVVAAGVALRQYQVARAKFKLDLFEKRYDIFFKTWEHLSSIVTSGPGPMALSAFDNERPKAAFLFGPDIETYMKDISSKRTTLWSMNLKSKSRGDVMHPDDIEDHTALLNWFVQEASEGAKKKFAPYLNFSNWT
jgi:hypothetical protein